MSHTTLDLFPHQKSALHQLRIDWHKSDTHLLQSPVGSGKTGIAAEIIAGAIKSGKRCMFIVPYVVLVEQTAKAFMSYGLPKPGIIWRDHEWTDPENLIQISSAQTLIRRDFPNVDIVIWDEAHLAVKKLLDIMAGSKAKWIGLSATPFGSWMGKSYDNFIKVAKMRELIDGGYLSDYDVYAPDIPSMKGVKTTNLAGLGKDYREAEVAAIMGESKIVGNIVKTWLELGENEPTIAYACNVAHANFLTVEFNRAGVKAEVITAETPKEERESMFKRFSDGLTKILVNVGVLVAGFDADVRCLIYARPTKSEARWIQCCGRAMRTANGKKRAIILDHSGTVIRLGLPCSIEYDDFRGDEDPKDSPAARKKEKEKKEKLPKVCSKCNYMKPAGQYVCAKCGFKPIGGENVDVDETRGLTKIKGEKKEYTKEDKQDWWSELRSYRAEVKLQRGKNYSDGYLSHLFKAKFGTFPRSLKDDLKPVTQEVRNFIKSRQIAFAKSKK